MKKCKSLRIDQVIIDKVEQIAKAQNRSFNNMVEVILMEAIYQDIQEAKAKEKAA